MSIQELPADLIISICREVVKEEEKNSVLEKLKKTILKSIIDYKIKWDNEAIPSPFGIDFDKDIYEDELEYVIYNQIKNLSQKEKDTIICDYGIIKSYKLVHNYYMIGCGDSIEEFREYMNDEIDEIEIISLIIKDEIEFRNDWRNN